MVAQPLSGKNIVVTRPSAQAGNLCRLIEQQGGKAIRFPLLEIEAITPSPAQVALVDALHHCDIAFFVSANAVHHGVEAVLARRTWPASLRVAAVGEGSAQALREQGFSRVIAPESGFDSEAVLALNEFSAAAVHGRRVVIFRGDGGRDLLANALRRRGAVVEYFECYRRYRPTCDPLPLLEAARRRELHALTLTSSESVRNLAELVGVAGMTLLACVPLFAPHARIVAHARSVGFRRAIQTASGDPGMIDGLIRWRWT